MTCDCHDPLVFGCHCRPRRTAAPASAVRVLSCAPPCRRQHEAPPPIPRFGEYGAIHQAVRMSMLASHLGRNP